MRDDLTSIQEIFSRALLDVEQIDPALAAFKGNAALNRERFALYRGNLGAIWQQTCAAAYPVLHQLLGADFFSDVSRMYGLAYPSTSGNLTEFGDSMAEFIGSLDSCRDYPYLADVARLEWLVHRAYYLPFKNPLTLAQLAGVPAEQLSELHCQLQPCCALIESPWSIAEIWHAHQQDDIIFPAGIEGPTWNLVWRSDWHDGWTVQVSPISEAAYAALKALQDGAALGNALESAFDKNPEFAVQSELADWLLKQLIFSTSISTSTITSTK
jgi:hypothetical protein